VIEFSALELVKETIGDLNDFRKELESFRAEGPLDALSLAKLEEHFKAAHVYNSAAIEGNRLTLQETMLVLKEGIEVQDKPLKETLEVKRLGEAFDYLRELVNHGQVIRERDIRDLHKLLIGDEPALGPGAYRNVGVIISGSEHRPPEPLAVPGLVSDLVEWINRNSDKDPIVLATLAHHQLAAIHPFKDGNGRVSRLLMNLILMQHGYPICNIRQERRPSYYEALSFGDVGIFDPLARQIKEACAELFSEYQRIRTETKRAQEWAAKWGVQEAKVAVRRETRELELWQSKIKQVFLEFQNTVELLDDSLDSFDVEFYDFKNEIDLEKYQRLIDKGFIERANAFSITFTDRRRAPEHSERFMFRYCRPATFVPRKVITLELNHLDKEDNKYIRIADSVCRDRIRLQYLYIDIEGKLAKRSRPSLVGKEKDSIVPSTSELVQTFIDDVMQNVLHLS
jgi:Fic family protein